MNRLILTTIMMTSLSFSYSLEDRLQDMKVQYNIKDDPVEDKSFLDKSIDVFKELDMTDPKSLKKTMTKAIDVVKEEADIDTKWDDFSIDKTIREAKNSIDFESQGESYGLPSVFGFNKKKDTSLFGSEALGSIKNAGSGVYSGFKNSGTTAEFTTGMMYQNAKMYNTMFDMFDKSPFNVFGEDEEESSMFDIMDMGNSLMDKLK